MEAMRLSRFQFRLSTLLWIVTGTAIYVGVMRAIWGDNELMLVASAVHGVTGFASMIYGTRMIDVTNGNPWSRLVVIFGFLLISVGLVAGCSLA
jgi:hypothetical protein